MPEQPEVRPVATEREAKTLASTVRMRILRLCLHQPRTNRELADALQMNPATVLHHVRRLVDTDFLVAGDPRKGARGSREIPYRATGKSWGLSVSNVSNLLVSMFVDDVARVPPEQVDSNRLGIKLSDADFAEFSDRLHSLLREVAAKPADPTGRAWSIFVAVHPDADNS